MAPLLADESLYAFTDRRPPSLDQLRIRYAQQARGRSPDGRQLWFNWILRVNADGAAAGFVQATVSEGPTAELAWTVAVGHQHQGYAREAAAEVTSWLASLGVRTFVAHIHPGNKRSQAVARALGLEPTDQVLEGEVRWVGLRSDGPPRAKPGAGSPPPCPPLYPEGHRPP